MTRPIIHVPDPRLDLLLERVVDVPPELVWACWTVPEHVKQWFTPAPWQTIDCEIDLRPGGIFRTVMRGPEGQTFDNAGCYLEIVPCEKLVWTAALGPGYRPRSAEVMSHVPFLMTAVISLSAEGSGTRYRALVIHGDEAGRAAHEKMGFHAGWGKALEQLVAVARHLPR